MGRVVHFELPADDFERAAAFYRNVFNCTEGNLFGLMQADTSAS